MALIQKAVFPVAGFGTRFLPATKANPKEMLPIVDKPLIQYAVEEAARAGITHMVFVTNAGKRAIEDHFDNHFELETRLQQEGREELLALVRDVSPPGIQFTYVRQNQPLGLGHAVLCAEHVIGQEPFAVLLADDLVDDIQVPCLQAMTAYYEAVQHTVFAVQGVPWDKVRQYGVVRVEDPEALYSRVLDMVEKPTRAEAPSNLAAVGRYVFSPQIFQALRATPRDHRGEIQLTDAIQRLLQYAPVDIFQFRGKRYDCGSKLGYLLATVALALRHPDVGDAFAAHLRTMSFETTSVE